MITESKKLDKADQDRYEIQLRSDLIANGIVVPAAAGGIKEVIEDPIRLEYIDRGIIALPKQE